MESETTAVRPIIRIEIQNDIANNQMDVDTAGEVEDGEVSGEDNNSDDCDDENKKMDVINSKTINVGSKWWNKEGGFSTGVDIFSKNEQEKLTVRARRFGIRPNESKAVTETQLQEVYDSLNLSLGDEKMVRFDALHMRGVEEMSTKDVFGYFSLYAPSSIEWINDYSCNVVWLDNVSASRALHGLSKRINGFDFTDEENPFVPKEPSDTEAAEEEEKLVNSRKGRSILLISKDDDQELDENDAINNDDWESEEPIDITEISIPIPPGYWRYGQPHPKAKSILLRFAFKTDKKPFKAEKLSEYYKKYGNPNFGGMKGLISQSRKRQLKGGNPERQVLVADDIDIDPTGKNPWGTLAERWSNEDRGVVFNEPKEIIREPFKEQRIIITNKSLQERIGIKRRISRTDLPEDDTGTVESSDAKRKKLPRMRMYADEEQERINRLKSIKKLSQTKKQVEIVDNKFRSRSVLENNTDLRNRLSQTDKRRLPEITVRVPQIIEEKRSVSNRFENRLGGKVTKNTFRSSSQYEEDRVHYRISERVYESEDGDVLEEDDYIPDTRQRSTVKVVVRNRPKPTIASTISRGTSSLSRKSGESRSWRLSDREQFRSKRYEDEHRSSDLRNKISDSKSRSSRLLRDVKKEPSSDSSESSDSESESSSSESGSSSSDSDSSSDESPPKKHTSVLKKTALPVIKSDKKTTLTGVKDTLRIEVHNDSYKKT